MKREHCPKRSILFCLLCGNGAWTFFRSHEPVPGKALAEIDLVPFLEERLSRDCNHDDCLAMTKAMPGMSKEERVSVYYEDDDPDRPAIHPDDLEAWFARAFPKLVAGKASA